MKVQFSYPAIKIVTVQKSIRSTQELDSSLHILFPGKANANADVDLNVKLEKCFGFFILS